MLMNNLADNEAAPERLHVHLDPLGGLAGDMFIAALLHAFPEHEAAVMMAAETVSGAPCCLLPAKDSVLTGARFKVGAEPHHHDHRHHAHSSWRDIRVRIEASALAPGVQARAIDIFGHLAAAEARVHGIAVDAVEFHEVGAVDSIADIAGAALLIEALHGASWSVGALPLGGGLVRTQHGMLPVPAPATALLLEGFETIDDGITGERVTPTGAAILRHLGCVPRQGLNAKLARSGLGFGTRTLPGTSNVLRVLAFERASQPVQNTHRDLAVINFEVDDQSAEDLAMGLDRLRGLDGVHDTLQMPVFGKKGRMATHVQVLVRPDALEALVEACFCETTTIGLRTHLVQGRALARDSRTVSVDGVALRVKRVMRPGGRTGKVEADDLRGLPGRAAREQRRRLAEAQAEHDGLERDEPETIKDAAPGLFVEAAHSHG
jgi:uncharacterized protein (TIGR00299 family) protein